MTTIRTLTDAGLLREHLSSRYADVLREGGSSEVYWRARGLANRLAAMVGRPVEEVIAGL